MTPEVVAHYRTLRGLVDRWKDNAGSFSDYQQLAGYIHVVHQNQVPLVDVWNLRAYQARLEEAIVSPSVSSGPTYPVKFPMKVPCLSAQPQMTLPKEPPPGLELRVDRVLMMHHDGSEEMSE